MRVPALTSSVFGVLVISHLCVPQSPPSRLQTVALVGKQTDFNESTLKLVKYSADVREAGIMCYDYLLSLQEALPPQQCPTGHGRDAGGADQLACW